jgi:hypothetical protein
MTDTLAAKMGSPTEMEDHSELSLCFDRKGAEREEDGFEER